MLFIAWGRRYPDFGVCFLYSWTIKFLESVNSFMSCYGSICFLELWPLNVARYVLFVAEAVFGQWLTAAGVIVGPGDWSHI